DAPPFVLCPFGLPRAQRVAHTVRTPVRFIVGPSGPDVLFVRAAHGVIMDLCNPFIMVCLHPCAELFQVVRKLCAAAPVLWFLSGGLLARLFFRDQLFNRVPALQNVHFAASFPVTSMSSARSSASASRQAP